MNFQGAASLKSILSYIGYIAKLVAYKLLVLLLFKLYSGKGLQQHDVLQP